MKQQWIRIHRRSQLKGRRTATTMRVQAGEGGIGWKRMTASSWSCTAGATNPLVSSRCRLTRRLPCFCGLKKHKKLMPFQLFCVPSFLLSLFHILQNQSSSPTITKNYALTPLDLFTQSPQSQYACRRSPPAADAHGGNHPRRDRHPAARTCSPTPQLYQSARTLVLTADTVMIYYKHLLTRPSLLSPSLK